MELEEVEGGGEFKITSPLSFLRTPILLYLKRTPPPLPPPWNIILFNMFFVNFSLNPSFIATHFSLNCPQTFRHIKFLAVTLMVAVLSWDIELVQRADQYKDSVVLYRPYTAQLAWWTKGRQVKLEYTYTGFWSKLETVLYIQTFCIVLPN